MPTIQKLCLKKYFKHKDEKEDKSIAGLGVDTWEAGFILHPKVEKIISDSILKIKEEPE